MTLPRMLSIDRRIIQASTAEVSSAAMSAVVPNAGALGSLGVGATRAEGASGQIAAVDEGSKRSFNVKVFCQ
jgi:nitronate monooxygenase